MKWIALAVGGIAGTFSRYILAGIIYNLAGVGFPYGTLAVNLIGCFLIGVLDVFASEKFILGTQARMLLMVGFCGAFTTFSAFILETGDLVKDGETLAAFANVMISVALGFGVYRLGIVIGRIV